MTPCNHPAYALRDDAEGTTCTVCWTTVGPRRAARPVDPELSAERARRLAEEAERADRLAHRPTWTGD